MSHLNQQYQTIEEIKNLITTFDQCTLPHSEWNHSAHLTVAIWYLTQYEEIQAIHLIRQGIQQYNAAMNIQTTLNSGYHETLTLFWIYIVRNYLAVVDRKIPIVELTNKLIYKLQDKNIPKNYYSQDVIMSWEARNAWIEPDLQPLDVFPDI
ncbi:hypothetical protein IQ244_14395 [Nostoc sp. LEGE 06077]|uniref:hypothetical protein n=1 Tax=Nostoc sp. LEGE 06077 TaxID=915325 RepID=UPI00187FA16B|nr:hypothetical protein [Nostoc sp. LEGE 06077]MBE9207687.1 hypothetical protein [Nostoc sp. LEGE 06077]